MSFLAIIRAISILQEPQLVPAPVAAPTASTVAAPAAHAASIVRAPTLRQAQTIGPTSAMASTTMEARALSLAAEKGITYEQALAHLREGGKPATRNLVPLMRQLFGELITSSEAESWTKDAKTELQEWLQGRKLPVPTYRIVATRGQAHAQTFDVECAVPALGLTEQGEGRSRRTAEQEAARRMLGQEHYDGSAAGLRNLLLCVLIAVAIWLMTPDSRGNLFTAWIYSTAIGTGCWFFIDGGRLLLAGGLPSDARLAPEARRAIRTSPRRSGACGHCRWRKSSRRPCRRTWLSGCHHQGSQTRNRRDC